MWKSGRSPTDVRAQNHQLREKEQSDVQDSISEDKAFAKCFNTGTLAYSLCVEPLS